MPYGCTYPCYPLDPRSQRHSRALAEKGIEEGPTVHKFVLRVWHPTRHARTGTSSKQNASSSAGPSGGSVCKREELDKLAKQREQLA